ncbi:hypothetical protein GYH30_014695 [Glycine max]|nr:hypothetical protein GYH30_014695 [Glycine max]
MAQNTEHTFIYSQEANSSSMGGNPPQLAVNDANQLPLFSPSTSAPLLDPDETESNCYVPSMVGLISSEEAGLSVQAQDMTTPTLMNYYNQYHLTQNNNLPITHEMGQVNEHNTSNKQLVPNMLANQNFNEINPQSSSYPLFFQQNPVNVQAGAENGVTNGHFMTNQTSPAFALSNHSINPTNAWNSPRSLWEQDQGNQHNPLLQNPSFQQQNSTLNGPTPMSSSGFATSSALNSAILGLSGTRFTGVSSSQVFNTQAPQFASLLRPERAPGVQQHQVLPLSVNTITPQHAGNGLAALAMSSSFRAQTSVPSSLSMLNQNGRSTFGSYGSYSSTLLPNPRGQREPPRRGRPRKHFEPGQVPVPPYKRRKKGNPGKTPLSRGNNTSDGMVREDQNPTNPSSDATASREHVNAMYDPAFEKAGVPIDPILRLFNATSEKPADEGPENPN